MSAPLISLIFMFIKETQNHRWTDDQYKNNGSINAIILSLINPQYDVKFISQKDRKHIKHRNTKN